MTNVSIYDQAHFSQSVHGDGDHRQPSVMSNSAISNYGSSITVQAAQLHLESRRNTKKSPQQYHYASVGISKIQEKIRQNKLRIKAQKMIHTEFEEADRETAGITLKQQPSCHNLGQIRAYREQLINRKF